MACANARASNALSSEQTLQLQGPCPMYNWSKLEAKLMVSKRADAAVYCLHVPAGAYMRINSSPQQHHKTVPGPLSLSPCTSYMDSAKKQQAASPHGLQLQHLLRAADLHTQSPALGAVLGRRVLEVSRQHMHATWRRWRRAPPASPTRPPCRCCRRWRPPAARACRGARYGPASAAAPLPPMPRGAWGQGGAAAVLGLQCLSAPSDGAEPTPVC